MSPVSHQTVKLSKGKHSSPEEGACVLELASMLAGEQFTDHPASVCPVIGSFMRAYNDSVGDDRRQDLYSYAAQVVGSRGNASVQRTRTQLLSDWATAMQRRRWTRVLPLSGLWTTGLRRQPSAQAVGTYAVRSIPRHTEKTHREALALLDELLAIGTTELPLRAPEVAEPVPPALYPIA